MANRRVRHRGTTGVRIRNGCDYQSAVPSELRSVHGESHAGDGDSAKPTDHAERGLQHHQRIAGFESASVPQLLQAGVYGERAVATGRWRIALEGSATGRRRLYFLANKNGEHSSRVRRRALKR